MAPSDGLTARQNRRPCNAICPGPPIAGHVSRSANWRSPSHGTRAQPDEPTCSSNRHRCQCRLPRRREGRPRHKTGVVSRVPCSFRNAQAFGTDRNTYLTSTHQRQRTDTPGQLADRRMRNRKTTNARPGGAGQLQELGYGHMAAASLMPKHVEGLVERLLAEGLTVPVKAGHASPCPCASHAIPKPCT